jgi:AP-1 complex subunit mu
MAVSAVCALDLRGRLLLARDYRGDVPPRRAEAVAAVLASADDDGASAPPVGDLDGVSYACVRASDVMLVALASTNSNAAAALLFLRRLASVFDAFFGGLSEETLRDNFVVAYELLDECMDYGYPQFTEGAILAEFIKTGAAARAAPPPLGPPPAVTNAVSWRSEGIRYKKNEVFLDVVERVNLTVAASGAVVSSHVSGALRMRAHLSGMPECRLGLNDRVLFEAQGRAGRAAPAASAARAVDLEDVKFHQCVRLARFDADRTISFVPPDGAFDLMTYRVSRAVKPLIEVECAVTHPARSRTEFLVKARANFKDRSTATGVEIALPLPEDAVAPSARASSGSAVYVPERSALVWKIKAFPGGKELLLRAKFNLPSVAAEDGRAGRAPPIRVAFEIPYFTVSGIQVRYLKVVEKTGYQALPWVRYVTAAGEYEVRMPE